MATRLESKDDPPELKKGKGNPVTGITPMVIPILMPSGYQRYHIRSLRMIQMHTVRMVCILKQAHQSSMQVQESGADRPVLAGIENC